MLRRNGSGKHTQFESVLLGKYGGAVLYVSMGGGGVTSKRNKSSLFNKCDRGMMQIEDVSMGRSAARG